MKNFLFLSLAFVILASSIINAQDQKRTRTIGLEKYRNIANSEPIDLSVGNVRAGGDLLFSENFDNTGGQLPAGWSRGGNGPDCIWNVDATPSVPGYYSADYSLNYNNGVNFDCGDTYGWVRTNLIPIGGNDINVSFMFNGQNECGGFGFCSFDQAFISILDESLVPIQQFYIFGTTSWNLKSYEISNINGLENIYVEFYFYSGDGLFNNFYGPFIDNLEIYGTALLPEVPISGWALYIGIGLILVFAVVRFRKMV